MKVYILEYDERTATSCVDKLNLFYSEFKERNNIKKNLEFEWIKGNIINKDEQRLTYDYSILDFINNACKKEDVALLMNYLSSEKGINSCSKSDYPNDFLSLSIIEMSEHDIPIFYLSHSVFFPYFGSFSLNRDIENQYLITDIFKDDDKWNLVKPDIERMFMYFISKDKNIIRNSSINHKQKKKYYNSY